MQKSTATSNRAHFGSTRGGLGEFETFMKTTDVFKDLHNFREFSQPLEDLECIDEAM